MNANLLEDMSRARRSQRLLKEVHEIRKRKYTDCRKKHEDDINLGEPAVKKWITDSPTSSCAAMNITSSQCVTANKNITSSSCSIVPMPRLVRRLNLNKSAKKKSADKTQTAEIEENNYLKDNCTIAVSRPNLEENSASSPISIQSSQSKISTNEKEESKEASTEEIVQHFWPYPHQRVTRNLSKVITKNVRENLLLPFVEKSDRVPPNTEYSSALGGTGSEINCSIVTILSDDEETQHIVEPPSNTVCDEQLINNLIKIYRNSPSSPPVMDNPTRGFQECSVDALSIPEDPHLDNRTNGDCGISSVVILDSERIVVRDDTENSQLDTASRNTPNDHLKLSHNEFTGEEGRRRSSGLALEETLNEESQVLSDESAYNAMGRSQESKKPQQNEVSCIKFDKSQYKKNTSQLCKETRKNEAPFEERWRKEVISRTIMGECHLQPDIQLQIQEKPQLQLAKNPRKDSLKRPEILQQNQEESQHGSVAGGFEKSALHSWKCLKQAKKPKLQPAESVQINQPEFGISQLQGGQESVHRLEDAQLQLRLNFVDITHENSLLQSGEHHSELQKKSCENQQQKKLENKCDELQKKSGSANKKFEYKRKKHKYQREKFSLQKLPTNKILPQEEAESSSSDRPVSLLTASVKTRRKMDQDSECQISEINREIFPQKFYKESRLETENSQRNCNMYRTQRRKNQLQRQKPPNAQSQEVDSSCDKPLAVLLSAVEKTVTRCEMENRQLSSDIVEKSQVFDIQQKGDESSIPFEETRTHCKKYRHEQNNNMIPVYSGTSSITVNTEGGEVPSKESREKPLDESPGREDILDSEEARDSPSHLTSKTLEQEIEENKCVSAALLLAVEKMMSLVDEESKQQNTERKLQNIESKQHNSGIDQQNPESKQQNLGVKQRNTESKQQNSGIEQQNPEKKKQISESKRDEKPRLPDAELRPLSRSASISQHPQSTLEPFSVLSLDDITSSVLQDFDDNMDYGLYTTIQVEDSTRCEPTLSNSSPVQRVKQNYPEDVSHPVNGLEGLRLSCAGLFVEEPASKQSTVNISKEQSCRYLEDTSNTSKDLSKMDEPAKKCFSSVEISSKDSSKMEEIVSTSHSSRERSPKDSCKLSSSPANSRTDRVPTSENNSPLQYNLDNPDSPPVDRDEFEKQERYFSNIFPTPPEDIAEESRFNAASARCSVSRSVGVQNGPNGGILNGLQKEENHQDVRSTLHGEDSVEPMFSVSDCCDLEELRAISDFIKMLKTGCSHEVAAPNTILIISRHEPLHSWVYLMGIVRRLRIVTAQWVIDCLNRKYVIKNLDEYYPNSRDPGPARSQTAEHPPFEGIYICTELLHSDKIKELIEEGGATVVPTLQDFRNSTQDAFPRFFLFEDEDDLTVDVIQNLSRDSTLAVPVHLNWIYHCVSNFNSSFINEYLARCFFVHPEILIKNYRIPTGLVQLTDDEDDQP